jgi:site-specific recombinase XerD
MTTDLTPYQNQELVSGGDPLDLAIAAWLDSKAGRSGSIHTGKIYRTTIADFRAQLHASGLDLDSAPRTVALAAQGWAGRNNPAPATHNRHLAVLSSFYAFCRKRGLLLGENPIGLVERRQVQSYAGIEALAPADVRPRLASIDRSTLAGLRDYALLNCALATGRRVAELAGMRWAHLHFDGDRIRLHFPRAKGGKVMSDTLPAGVSRALSSYLHSLYGAELARLRPDAPIWVALSRNQPGRPALSVRSLETICHERLGIHFHGLRHTFARTMEDAGAKVSDIQGRLGHASLATTGRYLAALRSSENPHADQVAELLGLGA